MNKVEEARKKAEAAKRKAEEEAKKRAEELKKTQEATYDNLLLGASSEGYWKVESEEVLKKFFVGAADFPASELTVQLLGKFDTELNRDTAWRTILALYVLQEVFYDNEDQSALKVLKARQYLKKLGIENPSVLVDAVSLTTIEIDI